MANNRVVVNFDFKANIGDVQSNLSALKNNLLQIQTIGSNASSFLGVNQGLKQASIAAQQLQTHLAGATNPFTKQLDLSMFSKSLQGAGLNVTQLSNSLLGAGATGQQAFKNLALTIASAQAPALQLSATMGKLMTTFANNARWMISSSVLTGFVSGIREAVDYTKDLNESLTDIRIVTGKSKEEMDSVARSANKMAKELKTSTAEIVKGQLIYYQQGDSAELAAKKAEITTKAANVSFGTSQEQMSEYLTAIWNSYQVGEENLEQVVDVLAAVGATTATSMEEIATAMQKVAATGNAVGVSYEQLTATIATISSVTRTSSEQVGTALKTIYARIGDLKAGGLDEDDIGLGQVSSGLKKVGVEILDTNNNVRDMGEVVEEIGAKWEGWTEAQQQAIVQLIAGKRQYTQMMALFENWDMYESTLATAEGADGELDKQQEIWAESWEAASQNVQASLESIYTKVFDDDVFIDLLNILNGVIVTFDTLTDAFGGIGPILMQISALLIHHFKVPILDAFASVKHGFNILTGDAQKAHEQMRNQFFQGIDFSQMDSGLKMEIQSLGQLTEIQDQYKLNMSQIHKAQRLQIENSIEIAQALRNQALAQQETADKQKQSIANTITASKASSSTKEAARKNFEIISEEAMAIEQTRMKLRNAQEVGGKFNPSAAAAVGTAKSTTEDRNKFLKENQEAFNKVLEQTKKYYQDILNQQQHWVDIIEKVKNKETELNQQKNIQAKLQNEIDTMENASEKDRNKYDTLYGTGAFDKNLAAKKAELEALTKSITANGGVLTKWKNQLSNAGISMDSFGKETQETKDKISQIDKAMKIMEQVLSGADVEADDFALTIKMLNQGLATGTLSQDHFAEQFRKIGSSLGLVDDQLDLFVKEILEFISNGAAAGLTSEQFKKHMDNLADSIRKAAEEKNKLNKEINGESLMNAASAMMSISSAASSVSNMFKTFGDESASAVDKVTSATGALTQGIFAVTMAMKMFKGMNGWLVGITIALSLLPTIIEGIDAIWETQTEKVERLKKETEELTEKYNEQKAVIDELQAKKEAGVDNQAQLNALDEEIIREQRKLKLIEEQKQAKLKEMYLEENEKIEKTFDSGKYHFMTNTNDDRSDIRKTLENTVSFTPEVKALFTEFENGALSYDQFLEKIDLLDEKLLPDSTRKKIHQYAEEHSEYLSGMLQDIETYTENGGKLTDNMINSLSKSFEDIYGGDMTSEAIAQLGSYISGIDKMSDTELQSLLEKLFPEKAKDTLVARFRQGLQEVDGEMDKFGKNQTLARSLENAGKAIDKVQSALKEIDDTGFMSYSTIEEMGAKLDKAGVASAEWKQALYDANGNAEKTKEVLSQIVNEIANATIEVQKFSEKLHFNDDGSLTTESQEYVDNVEKMIAAQLRSNGVQNATEIAHKKVAAATMKARIEQQNLANELPQTEKELYNAKNAAYAYATYLATADFTYTSVDSIKNLEDEYLAILGVVSGYETLSSIKTLVNKGFTFDSNSGYRTYNKDGKTYFVDPNTRKQYDSSGKEIGGKFKGDLKSLTYHNVESDIKKASEKLKENTNNFDGGDNKFEVKEVNPSDSGGGNNDPWWKIDYEKRLEQIEYEAERDGLTKLELGRKLRELYNEYYGHMFEIEDKKTGKTYEKYFFDKAKNVISNLKDGLTEAFDDELANAERTGVYDYAKLSTLLSDTLKQAAIEGVTFSEEEKNELIDTYVSEVQGLMSEASSDLDTKFENQEFFSGVIDFDKKMAGYDDLLKTSQDYLDDLRANEATEEQLAEYENSVVIPLIKKKRDLLKEEADAAKEATEHYIKMSEFYGYKNGDNEIKARERAYKKMLNLTEEQILAEYGTYKEYWYALEEERLEIDQIFRDKLKEALEKEKDDRIAILEAEKNAAEKLYEGENTLREKRKQINDQLQESLTMYQYLDKATRKLIFNEEDYLALSDTLNEIEEDMYDLNQQYLKDIVGKEADELEYINAEYERQNELLMNRYEIAEKELNIIKARSELENTLKERNTQMFINGRWQWVADQKAVIEAQKKLNDAEFDKETSELENEQELLINSFEKQIDNANQAWEKATKVLEDKVMTVAELMSSLSEPMDDLTAKFYELATGKKITSRGEQKSIEDANSKLAKDTALAIIRKKEEYDAAKAQGNMTKAQEIEEQAKASYQVLEDLGYNELAEELHKSDLATAKKLNLDELTATKQQTDEVVKQIENTENAVVEAIESIDISSEKEEEEKGGTGEPVDLKQDEKVSQIVNDIAWYKQAWEEGDEATRKEAEKNAKLLYDELKQLGRIELAEKLANSTYKESVEILNQINENIKKSNSSSSSNGGGSSSRSSMSGGGSSGGSGKSTISSSYTTPDGVSVQIGTNSNGDTVVYNNEGGHWHTVGIVPKVKGGKARGSRSVIKGFYEINEIGEETYVTPDGHFRNFAGGEVVFTHEQSQRLFSLLNADLFNINKMPRVGEFEQSNSNDTYISIGGISIDTTTQDGKDLVEILQRITNI